MHFDPDLVLIFSSILMGVLALPIAVAIARRIQAAPRSLPDQLPADLVARLERMEHIMEATQLEVERMSEGQRFTTRLLTERADDDFRSLHESP